MNGLCALRYDHPACCGVRRRRHYGQEEREEEGRQLAATGSEGDDQATTQGHWEGPEWYCWD